MIKMSTTRRDFITLAASSGLGLAVSAPMAEFAAADSRSAASLDKRKRWSNVDFGKISIGGELAKRSQQNRQRLQHPAYSPPKAFVSMTADSWPGDWVGRSLLAQTLLARSTGQDEHGARQIIQALPAHVNTDGYLGPLLDPKALNEQQLAAHCWMFRGLSEYVTWTQDPAARAMLEKALRTLALPVADHWSSYPLTREAREREAGGVVGHSQWQVGNWLLSTDIGAVFYLLDGLSHAWRIAPSKELKAAIDAGIDRFLNLDLIGVQAQTHATLSTLRALLRMYAATGETRLLRAVEERYALYRREAMTENYANYNYFARPETWTEPCAIVDSFIVAMQLWQFTEQAQYLEDAHLIWFNGVGRGQRPNGGFGCDTCAGVEVPFIKLSLAYEAYFCCTMRGAEGLSYAIQSGYFTRPGEIAVTSYNDSTAELDVGAGRVVLQQSTRYPYDGTVQLKFISSNVRTPVALRLFTPSWLSDASLKLNGRPVQSRSEQGFLATRFKPRAGDVLTLESTLKNWVRPTRNPHSLRDYYVFHAGPLVLGYDGMQDIAISAAAELVAIGPGQFQVKGRDVVLGRINDVHEQTQPKWDPIDLATTTPDRARFLSELLLSEANSYRRQVLFRQS